MVHGQMLCNQAALPVLKRGGFRKKGADESGMQVVIPPVNALKILPNIFPSLRSVAG